MSELSFGLRNIRLGTHALRLQRPDLPLRQIEVRARGLDRRSLDRVQQQIELVQRKLFISIPPSKAALRHEPGVIDLNGACKSAAS